MQLIFRPSSSFLLALLVSIFAGITVTSSAYGIDLPIEVLGPEGTERTVTFSLQNSASG